MVEFHCNTSLLYSVIIITKGTEVQTLSMPGNRSVHCYKLDRLLVDGHAANYN